LPKTPCFDDLIAEARARLNIDLYALNLLGRVLSEQLFIRTQPGLTLGLPRARSHTDPLELAGQRPLPLRLAFLLERQSFLLLIQPGRVVSLPGNPGPAVELQNPSGDVVEEVAI